MSDMDYDDDDVCQNCGGEGFVYDCQDEIGCVDPEGGCDLCMYRCDWCRPKKPKVVDAGDEMHQILGDALKTAKGKD